MPNIRQVSPGQFAFDFTDVAEQVVDGLEQASGRVAKTVQRFAHAIEEGVQGMRPRLMEAHSQVARAAQAAVIDRYEEARSEGRRSPPYRIDAIQENNRRYAGGMLLEALSSSEFAVASEDGILFADREMLDARARQWHRLSFGAGGGAADSGGFQVDWGGMVAFTLGMEDEEASPSFRLPAGYWIEPGGEFYPLGELEETPGAPLRSRGVRTAIYQEPRQVGVKAEGFLQAGVRTMAEMLPRAWEGVVSETVAESTSRLQGTHEQVTARTHRAGVNVSEV